MRAAQLTWEGLFDGGSWSDEELISVRGQINNADALIDVKNVASLLPGLDDRSGNSGGVFRHTKRVLLTTRKHTVAIVTVVWMRH